MLPIALVIRPPLNLDEMLQWLQLHTSRFASSVLYSWRVDHILSGNKIVPVSGNALFVEEACSGVQSLFTVLFIAAFLIVSRRYPLFRGILLLATAVFWALMMNVFRVVIIAWAQVRWGVDLAHGWQHEAIGYIGIGAAILLLLSADRLLAFLFGGIPDDPRVNVSINPLVTLWNRLLVPRDLALLADTTGVKPNSGASTSRVPVLAAPVAVVAVLFVAGLPAYTNLDFTGASRSIIAEIAALKSVDAEWLPAETFAKCKVLSFRSEDRPATSVFGASSEEWVVDSPIGSILHSIDHPFSGWHNLADCYQGVGWQLKRLRPVDSFNSGEAWPVMFAEFSMPTGERALLCFSEFSIEGKPTQPAMNNRATTRLLARWNGIDDRPVQTIQVQSLVETFLPADGPNRDQLLLFHEQVRDAAFRKITGREPPAEKKPDELRQEEDVLDGSSGGQAADHLENAPAAGELQP
jgi:exosortase/archaeosortase family protein